MQKASAPIREDRKTMESRRYRCSRHMVHLDSVSPTSQPRVIVWLERRDTLGNVKVPGEAPDIVVGSWSNA